MKSVVTRSLALLRRLSIWLLVVIASISFPKATALKHSFETRHDGRHLIGPVGVPFGFLEDGVFSLTVKDFKLEANVDVSRLDAGFWLQRFPNEASFQHYMNELQANTTGCAFEYFLTPEGAPARGKRIEAKPSGLFLSLKDKSDWKESSIDYTFQAGEEGLYFLVYQVCHSTKNPPKVWSKFHLDFHFYNYDSNGGRSYLTAGEMHLPGLYTLSAISFTICALLWQINLRRIRQGFPAIIRSRAEQAIPPSATPTIYAIHPIMGLLIWVKALTVWAEAFRFHTIKNLGHAEVWSALYYTLYFFRGTFLFTVILLIGTGWSFVKGVMLNRDKRFIFLVLFLQMLNQLALVVLSQESEGERWFGDWNAVLHLVDILCCCAVLLPIVWQVNAMEASLKAQDFDDDSVLSRESRTAIVEKLKVFRLFYLLVIAYIYATRILIYMCKNIVQSWVCSGWLLANLVFFSFAWLIAVATVLDYKHLWVRYAVVELVTLVFYVTVGLLFRPQVEGQVDAAAIRRDEEFDNEEEEGVALVPQSAVV